MITNWDAMEEQIIFYRTHLDIFIEDAFPPIKLSRDQHVIARAIGNCRDADVVQNRGAGKTWLIALCCHALCCLYPQTFVAVCSKTAKQAKLVLEKLKFLAERNPNIANELMANNARSLVQISQDKGRAVYKNGSKFESFAMESARGQRAKIVVVDEAREVDPDVVNAVVSPLKNYRREISFENKFQDYASKTIRITSACEKALPYYQEFAKTLKNMASGDKLSFACALDWRAAVENGVNQEEYFIHERENNPEVVFAMEYESKFVGSTNNSAFPYELTQKCRTLQRVELEQPKNSKSRYVISLDIATSDADIADNSILSVLKFMERTDGTFNRKLVYMRSFHGKSLDILAEEVRKLYHLSFPNAEKIIYDARGLGDSLDRFFDKEWVDYSSEKEYPPLVVDDEPNMNAAAQPMLHPFRAIQSLNQRLYTNMRVALEKQRIELPIPSRLLQQKELEKEDKQKMSMYEKAIYAEADALQFEMGNIVAKVSASGNVLYDTTNIRLHKDRYSSLAMANDYISELEKVNIKRFNRGAQCVGLASAF